MLSIALHAQEECLPSCVLDCALTAWPSPPLARALQVRQHDAADAAAWQAADAADAATSGSGGGSGSAQDEHAFIVMCEVLDNLPHDRWALRWPWRSQPMHVMLPPPAPGVGWNYCRRTELD